MNLSSSNCSVDKETGAVMFHKSPELQELLSLKKEVHDLNKKVDVLIEYIQTLKGGSENG